jgi:hypothetical protein
MGIGVRQVLAMRLHMFMAIPDVDVFASAARERFGKAPCVRAPEGWEEAPREDRPQAERPSACLQPGYHVECPGRQPDPWLTADQPRRLVMGIRRPGEGQRTADRTDQHSDEETAEIGGDPRP